MWTQVCCLYTPLVEEGDTPQTSSCNKVLWKCQNFPWWSSIHCLCFWVKRDVFIKPWTGDYGLQQILTEQIVSTWNSSGASLSAVFCAEQFVALCGMEGGGGCCPLVSFTPGVQVPHRHRKKWLLQISHHGNNAMSPVQSPWKWSIAGTVPIFGSIFCLREQEFKWHQSWDLASCLRNPLSVSGAFHLRSWSRDCFSTVSGWKDACWDESTQRDACWESVPNPSYLLAIFDWVDDSEKHGEPSKNCSVLFVFRSLPGQYRKSRFFVYLSF